MATPGDLITTIAKCAALPEALITTWHRALREHGLVTKAGRGPSAARPTPRDAATLLLAVLGSRYDRASAVDVLKTFDNVFIEFGEAQLHKNDQLIYQNVDHETGNYWLLNAQDVSFQVDALKSLKRSHSILDCIEGLIIAMINCEYSGAAKQAFPGSQTSFGIELSVYGPMPFARVSLELEGWYDNHIMRYREEREYIPQDLMKQKRSDLLMTRAVTRETIKTIADLLREDYIRKHSGKADD